MTTIVLVALLTWVVCIYLVTMDNTP